MAEQRGGYQPPRNPAPVSGPGALSRRTDAPPLTGGGEYGETKALEQLQQSAPMDGAQQQQSPFVGLLDADSARPDEPVTAGADAGDGPGAEVLGLAEQTRVADVRAILPYLPVLEFAADRPNAAPSTRAMVRMIRGML